MKNAMDETVKKAVRVAIERAGDGMGIDEAVGRITDDGGPMCGIYEAWDMDDITNGDLVDWLCRNTDWETETFCQTMREAIADDVRRYVRYKVQFAMEKEKKDA